MKKIFIVFLLLVMATSLSGCFKSKKSADENQQSAANQEEESFFGSMQDLLTRGKSVKCTYKSTDDGAKEATGVLYVAGNKTRSEMSVIEEETGKKLEINSIIIGDWMYMWNNFMQGGTKMNIKEMQGEVKVDEKYSQGEVDKMKEKIDYKCRPWIPDNSKFDIPTNIEFRDMTKIMEGFQDTMGNINMDEVKKSGEEAKQKLCDMCEMLTGQAKNQCRADAGCE